MNPVTSRGINDNNQFVKGVAMMREFVAMTLFPGISRWHSTTGLNSHWHSRHILGVSFHMSPTCLRPHIRGEEVCSNLVTER